MKNFIYFVLFAFFVACTDNYNVPNIPNNDQPPKLTPLELLKRNNFKITQNVAKESLILYINNLQHNSRSHEDLTIIDDGKIDMSLNPKSRATNVGPVGVYKFIIKNGTSEGFALISDDIRYPKVLAYCPEGSLSDTLYNKGLAQYMREIPISLNNRIAQMTETLSDPKKYNNLLTSYTSKTNSRASVLWGDPYNLPPDAGDSLLNYPSVPLPHLNMTEQKGDTTFVTKNTRVYVYPMSENNGVKNFLVPVKWGQGSPYNNDVPFQCGTGKAPAGCVAIAIAQIMAYHRYPPTYNWDLLTQSPTISSTSIADENRRKEVARLIADIGKKVQMDYDCSGSGSNIYKANEAFINYGYTTLGVKDYYIFTTIWGDDSNINYFNPAYFNAPFYIRGTDSNGEGHAFVVDGFFESFMLLAYDYETWVNGVLVSFQEYAFPCTLFNSIITFHINWGWNGYSDGYYDQNLLDFDENKKVLKVDL